MDRTSSRFLHLKGRMLDNFIYGLLLMRCSAGIQISFKNKRPKYPVRVTLVIESVRDEDKSQDFESGGETLVWNTDMYAPFPSWPLNRSFFWQGCISRHLSPNSKLEVVVKDSHTLKWRSKKDFASVRFGVGEIANTTFVAKDGVF